VPEAAASLRLGSRLWEAERRLEEEHEVECRTNADYEAYRARGVERRPPVRTPGPSPDRPPATPAGKINVTDPDSRNVETPRGYMRGYSDQAVTTERRIVIAAQVTVDSPDFGDLEPMVSTARAELERPGSS
jgi:hypothetical protein